jgi:hypothetical protein
MNRREFIAGLGGAASWRIEHGEELDASLQPAG